MPALTASAPRLGVIEGFYGRPWDASARREMLDWLAQLGFDAYLYAPKADPWLRRQWRAPWPAAERTALQRLAGRAAAAGLDLGVGLSPYGAYRDYGAGERRSLRDRVLAIRDLGVTLLALLFDDMPGGQADLAAAQAAIAVDVAQWLDGDELLLCPTYYSHDPVLDRVFGPRPRAYLQDLAAALPDNVTLFWTGARVCSERIAAPDLPSRAERAGRALALWDNYPVNDSRERSVHLYLQSPAGRDPSLARELRWHWSNAMNQAALSLPALHGLAALYRRDTAAADAVYASAGLDAELRAACEPLARRSLAALAPAQRQRLERCAAGRGRAARELGAFLRGDYRFDPACLTG